MTQSDKEEQYDIRLAMYVYVRGYIPIEEEPFDKTIDDIQIDVREGVFVPLGKDKADDILANISMGCQVSRKGAGTLGLFFEHAQYGVCGITSAHVLLSPEELEDMKIQRVRRISGQENEVYQPTCPHRFGKLVEVIYKEGDDSNHGLEIGIIAIDERKPKSGTFPKPKLGLNDLDLKYSSGRAGAPRQNNLSCVKFGISTGYTIGTIANRSLPNVMRTLPWVLESGTAKLLLYNQLEIEPETGSFAEPGDSGAPVFVKDGDGELVCIGIICGNIHNTKTRVATPITVILEELGIIKLKTFNPNLEQMQQDIAKLVQNLLSPKNETQ